MFLIKCIVITFIFIFIWVALTVAITIGVKAGMEMFLKDLGKGVENARRTVKKTDSGDTKDS